MELNRTVVVLAFIALTFLDASQATYKYVALDGIDYLFSSNSELQYKTGDATHTLLKSATMDPKAIDYNYAKGLVFLSDKNKAISSVPLLSDRATPTTLINTTEQVTDVAVDWVHDRVIWAQMYVESGKLNSKIMSANANGGNQQTLRAVADAVGNLAVDPYAGKIFWIDGTKNIASCNLDGTDYKVLLKVERSLKTPNFPTAITLDLQTRRMYYLTLDYTSMSNFFILNSMDYDGGNVTEVTKILQQTDNRLLIDIPVLQAVNGRLLIMSSTVDVLSNKKRLRLENNLDGNVEEAKDLTLTEASDVLLFNIILVHPDFQPATDPKA